MTPLVSFNDPETEKSKQLAYYKARLKNLRQRTRISLLLDLSTQKSLIPC